MYQDAAGGDAHRVDVLTELGRGSARWVANAIQLATHVMAHRDYIALEGETVRWLSGQVLFLDEPEAHLHPSAVRSVVRWCQSMVKLGLNLVVASHHEEFLRSSGMEVTLVHVNRDAQSSETRARALQSRATSARLDLADEVGMHPASALSLYDAILFVEGTLDVAVLDEFAGPALDAAGVTIVPIGGTKNMPGLVDGEFVTRVGLKSGVLTDNTVTATMLDRSNNKRSGEEVKIVRLLQRYEELGLPPPDLFGVPEEDLLFAVPVEAIRICYPDTAGDFPGWLELREECRVAEGKGKQDSVDWKTYAETHYGLPISTPIGVRGVIRRLDLAGVELPSIRTIVDDIIAWAKDPRTG